MFLLAIAVHDTDDFEIEGIEREPILSTVRGHRRNGVTAPITDFLDPECADLGPKGIEERLLHLQSPSEFLPDLFHIQRFKRHGPTAQRVPPLGRK